EKYREISLFNPQTFIHTFKANCLKNTHIKSRTSKCILKRTTPAIPKGRIEPTISKSTSDRKESYRKK
ncbi:hypothetical protein Trydic_g5752, partial [Trypoxylus dichotomus]